MEDEIKVGEWVRSKDGQIIKLENNEEFYEDSVDVGIGIIPSVNGIWTDKECMSYIEKDNIAKHSFNLIDLIEVNDYVNGDKVVNKNDDRRELVLRNDTGFQYINDGNSNEINSIITHQQFKSIEYTIHEREEKENG